MRKNFFLMLFLKQLFLLAFIFVCKINKFVNL